MAKKDCYFLVPMCDVVNNPTVLATFNLHYAALREDPILFAAKVAAWDAKEALDPLLILALRVILNLNRLERESGHY